MSKAKGVLEMKSLIFGRKRSLCTTFLTTGECFGNNHTCGRGSRNSFAESFIMVPPPFPWQSNSEFLHRPNTVLPLGKVS